MRIGVFYYVPTNVRLIGLTYEERKGAGSFLRCLLVGGFEEADACLLFMFRRYSVPFWGWWGWRGCSLLL